MIVEPKITIHADTCPGTRVSDYVQINATCYVYAVKVRPECNNGSDVEWFVENRSEPCDYFPDLYFRIIRQEERFADAVAGL